MIVDASTVGGVAAIVARQLRYEFFFFHRSLRVGRLLPSLIRWRPGRWWMLRPHSCAPRKKRLEDKIERLRTQNIEAIRDKSTAENKSRNLLDKVDTLEKENEGLNCQLSELKDIVVQSQSRPNLPGRRPKPSESVLPNWSWRRGIRELIMKGWRLPRGPDTRALCRCVS
jgi:hypothetical protein